MATSQQFIENYNSHQQERAAEGLPPLAMSPEQALDLTNLLVDDSASDKPFLLELLTHRVPPGVDDAAKIKADFLTKIAQGELQCDVISKSDAVDLLGTMLGGFNIKSLINILDNAELADRAVAALSKTLLIFDAFHDVYDKSQNNESAKQVINSWAEAEWFTRREPLATEIKCTVFKVDGETNTDDLSPAADAWSRPDIPLHAKAMLKSKMPEGVAMIEELKEKGFPVAFVGDVVGTGSSRKSAINSVLWHMGDDIPYVPNKRQGGVILGGKIAPIFFNTAEDSGALPIECDVSKLNMGDVITIKPFEGVIENEKKHTWWYAFDLKSFLYRKFYIFKLKS